MYSSLFRRLGKSDTLIVLGTTVGGVCVCLTDLLLSAVGGLLLSSAGSGRFFLEEKSVPEKRLAKDGVGGSNSYERGL
jgi:hypothetical protein